jgi:hypothetical protein
MSTSRIVLKVILHFSFAVQLGSKPKVRSSNDSESSLASPLQNGLRAKTFDLSSLLREFHGFSGPSTRLLVEAQTSKRPGFQPKSIQYHSN